jgi:ubiquitin-conjugating enzyme E2 R
MHWKVALIVLNPDSVYHGGYFLASMSFPPNYPMSPPDFKFKHPLYHPNVYPDGRLCISILHAPGDDEMSGESADLRWSPAQRVESVLLSILSLLDDANIDSPANVDASVMYRDNKAGYLEKVKADLEACKKDVPEDFVMPGAEEAYGAKKEDQYDFQDDDWADSDAELDFSGSEGSDFDQDLSDYEEEE